MTGVGDGRPHTGTRPPVGGDGQYEQQRLHRLPGRPFTVRTTSMPDCRAVGRDTVRPLVPKSGGPAAHRGLDRGGHLVITAGRLPRAIGTRVLYGSRIRRDAGSAVPRSWGTRDAFLHISARGSAFERPI